MQHTAHKVPIELAVRVCAAAAGEESYVPTHLGSILHWHDHQRYVSAQSTYSSVCMHVLYDKYCMYVLHVLLYTISY